MAARIKGLEYGKAASEGIHVIGIACVTGDAAIGRKARRFALRAKLFFCHAADNRTACR
jgi:hypothetical protein